MVCLGWSADRRMVSQMPLSEECARQVEEEPVIRVLKEVGPEQPGYKTQEPFSWASGEKDIEQHSRYTPAQNCCHSVDSLEAPPTSNCGYAHFRARHRPRGHLPPVLLCTMTET